MKKVHGNTKHQKPAREVLEATYYLWLDGKSLDSLARKHRVSRQTLTAWFDETFGPLSTNPLATSFQRSIVQDYPKNAEVWEWLKGHLSYRSDVWYRSKQSINQQTKFQTAPDEEVFEILVSEKYLAA